MRDRFDRAINYLRIAVTDKCNLSCLYCRPEIKDEPAEDILSAVELEKLAREFAAMGIEKIRLTGGEPLVRSDIVEIVHRIGSVEGLKDLAMTTNGIYLKKNAPELKKAGLKRVNISMDSLNEKKYEKITGGGRLKQVLDGIESAVEAGLLPVKVNVVLIKGVNEHEVGDFIEFTRKNPIELRFIELMPVGQVVNWAREKFIAMEDILQAHSELIPDVSRERNSIAACYRLRGAKGTVGFISAVSSKFCADCSRLRLTADGKLKPCLHSDMEIDIRKPLREGGDLRTAILEAVYKKPLCHQLDSNIFVGRDMVDIGG